MVHPSVSSSVMEDDVSKKLSDISLAPQTAVEQSGEIHADIHNAAARSDAHGADDVRNSGADESNNPVSTTRETDDGAQDASAQYGSPQNSFRASERMLVLNRPLPPGIRLSCELQKVTINEDPHIVMFKNFLNDAEIEYLLKQAEGEFRPSLTGTADAYKIDNATSQNRMELLEEKASQTRTSYSCVLDPDDDVVVLVSRQCPPSHICIAMCAFQ